MLGFAVDSTRAIVLRRRPFSETSLIVSWCTESLGCIQTIAKGARRPRNVFSGRLDLFYEAEIQVARSKKSNLHTLTEVEIGNTFPGIRQDYGRTQTAAYFVELIELCTERDHHEPELFDLLRRALSFLDGNNSSSRVMAHFEKELARLAGVHGEEQRRTPAAALANLFGKLPVSRAPLLKQLASRETVEAS